MLIGRKCIPAIQVAGEDIDWVGQQIVHFLGREAERRVEAENGLRILGGLPHQILILLLHNVAAVDRQHIIVNAYKGPTVQAIQQQRQQGVIECGQPQPCFAGAVHERRGGEGLGPFGRVQHARGIGVDLLDPLIHIGVHGGDGVAGQRLLEGARVEVEVNGVGHGLSVNQRHPILIHLSAGGRFLI